MQASTSIRPPSSFSPANPTAELLEGAPVLYEPGQYISTSTRQGKTGVNSGRIQKSLAKNGQRLSKVGIHSIEEVAAKHDDFLARNRQAAYKCREKKKTLVALVAHLLEREEFFAKNNAQLPYEIEQIEQELKGLRAIAIEHYTVCPIRSPELVAWFEKEVQYRITPASICHADRPSAPPPRDVDYAGTDRRCLSASQVDPVKLNAALSPALQIWPSLPTNFAPAPEPLPQDCYVTRPGLLYYGDTKSSTDFSSLLLKRGSSLRDFTGISTPQYGSISWFTPIYSGYRAYAAVP